MQIAIEVLGSLRVLVDGRPVELGPARRRALLAALTLDPGQVVPLDRLVDRVWDGEPPANPVAALHAYVSRLRASLRTLGPDGEEMPSLLVTRAPGYLLDVPASGVDAHRFAVAVRQARATASSGDALGARALVQEALDLWRGEAYADIGPGFARAEADRLAELRLDARELAAQVDLDLGRHDALVGELAGLVAEQPLREGLQRTYLVALYRSGRQADALRHYGVVRELMLEELGIDPSPELRATHEAILGQDPSLDAPAAQPPPAPTALRPPHGSEPAPAEPAPTTAAPALTAPTPVDDDPRGAVHVPGRRLVGRDRELARLHAVLAAAEAGAPTPVAVVGEAGIGKSRLVEEVATVAESRGALVVWGRCWQHEGAPVMWPWVQALEALTEAQDPQTLDRAVDGRAAAVTSLVPALAARATGPAAPAEGDRLRLYAAVTAFLEALAVDRTVVLVLEDMHWADPGTRELTEYVVAHLRTGRVALVLTVRAPTDDVARSGAELLTSLARSGRGERVDLTGLAPEAVAAYVADRTGSHLDGATSAALAERTAGNPFFVGELVRLLVTDLDGSEGLVSAVPDSVRDVIARRLERLEENDRTVLRVAAVVGRTFDLALLEAACDLGEDDVDEAIDRATAFGIVCSEPGRAGRHRFVHALTQQTLLDLTGPARLRRLHGRVAGTLEARGEPTTAELAEQLAFHLAASGGEDEVRRAVEVALSAADRALELSNFAQTESLLLRAVELVGRLPEDVAPRLETAARVRLWSLYTMTYGPGAPGAAGQHERVLGLIRRHGGARDILSGHQAVLARLMWVDDLDGVSRLVDEMTAAAEAADDDLMRAAAHLARAEELVHRGRVGDGLAEYAAIADLGPNALRNPPPNVFPIHPVCAVPLWRGLAQALSGDRAASRASHAELEALLGHATVTTVAYSDTMTAFTHALLDEPEAALGRARSARELAVRHGFVESLLFIGVLEAWARERLEPGTGLADLDAALDQLRPLPSIAMRPTMLGLRARLRHDAGDLDGARADLEDAEVAQERTGNRLHAAALARLRADLDG